MKMSMKNNIFHRASVSPWRKTKTIRPGVLLFLIVFLFQHCSDNKPQQELDTPVRGKIRLSIDENIRSVTDQLIDAFESSYPDAFLVQSYNPESKVMQELYNDSSRLAVMTRPLKPEEIKWFEAKTFLLEQIKIGSDAVVLVVNKNNPDSTFTTAQVRDILSGKISTWSQLRPELKAEKITMVFDNPASSNLRYLRDTLLNGQKPGPNCFALSSGDSVIAYVNQNPDAIGILGLDWLGDKDLNEDVSRRNMICMARVGVDSLNYYYPSQTNLVTKKYPFTREIWIVKIGKRAGLGTGFATFSLGERGQLIIQHAGLSPAKPAERKIQMTTY
jgi:phosphate transport system substrate-binding protein